MKIAVRLSLQPASGRATSYHADDGRQQIDVADRRCVDGAGTLPVRLFDQQWHPSDLVVHNWALARQSVRPHHVAVIGGEDDIGVLGSELVRGVDDPTDLAVYKAVAAKIRSPL